MPPTRTSRSRRRGSYNVATKERDWQTARLGRRRSKTKWRRRRQRRRGLPRLAASPEGRRFCCGCCCFFSFRGTTGGRRRIEENGRTCGTLRSPTAGSDCVRACALCVRNETVPLSLPLFFFCCKIFGVHACELREMDGPEEGGASNNGRGRGHVSLPSSLPFSFFPPFLSLCFVLIIG